jgi:16S rRNA processing protein RimM
MTDPKYLLIGEILRPHGVRGELRMRVLTDYPERIAKLKTVYLAHNPDKDEVVSHAVKHVRMHQDYALLTLNDVPDRNHAEHLRGLFVMVGLQDAVPLDDDEVYLYQLIGMEVHTEQGDFLGTVTDVLETGANDVYIVQSQQYGEVLIPVTDETILDTDTETNRITVKLPDGLLPS